MYEWSKIDELRASLEFSLRYIVVVILVVHMLFYHCFLSSVELVSGKIVTHKIGIVAK